MTEKKENKVEHWLKKKKRVLIGISTIFLIVFMIFIVDFNSMILKIITIGFFGTLLFVIFYTIAFQFRAIKLKTIFKGIDHNIKYSTSLFSLGVSFVINDITPSKFGDLVKIAFIKDQEDLKTGDSICGITIERVLDLLLLFSVSLFALFYIYSNNLNTDKNLVFLGQNIQFFLIMGSILIILIFVFFLLLFYKTAFILNIIGKFSKRIASILNEFIINLKEGIKKLKKNKIELISSILLNIPTWFFDAFIIVIFFYLLGYQLDILILILAIVVLFFSKSVQVTPGGWGVSENVGALFIYIFYPEIPYLEILSIFIIDHLFRSAYLFVFGGYSIVNYNIKLKELENIKKFDKL